MNSDQLGEKGENRFGEICADAGLICNKTTRDRAGWDFIVDFPISEQEELSMDHRAGPISCTVQLKTIMERNNTISMRLSMAERLAKDNKPCFVYVFKVNKELNFSDSYLVHIHGARLEAILKRLRKETQKNNRSINHLKISFTLDESEKIEYGGNAFKNAIEKYCKNGMHKYQAEKNTYRNCVGFASHPIEVKVTIEAEHETKLIDSFLEEGISIPVTELKSYETRFGIKLPLHEGISESIQITPNPAGECYLLFRNEDSPKPIKVKAVLYLTPTSFTIQKIVLKTKSFNIFIEKNDVSTRKYFQLNDIGNLRLTCSEWLQFWRVMQCIADPTGIMELIQESNHIQIDFKFQQESPYSLHECKSWERYLLNLIKILETATVENEEDVTMEELAKNQDICARLCNIFFQESPGITDNFDFDYPELPSLHEKPAIIAESLHVAGALIAYYAKAIIKINNNNKNGRLRLENVKFCKANHLQKKENFEKFINHAKSREGIDIVFSIN
ncbi:hypothetical protein [Pseudogulbenkiania ferrooxidans]|uniref:hypothetical protein n=1 Tax=Pseudogulbenkiania ferrooxidans TaxID=549169 RepID=UPI000414D973|nr:hypothetical protein [Pseudogulbenkiania ferrooxidans]